MDEQVIDHFVREDLGVDEVTHIGVACVYHWI